MVAGHISISVRRIDYVLDGFVTIGFEEGVFSNVGNLQYVSNGLLR